MASAEHVAFDPADPPQVLRQEDESEETRTDQGRVKLKKKKQGKPLRRKRAADRSTGIFARPSDNGEARLDQIVLNGQEQYDKGQYRAVLAKCELVYKADAFRQDNLLLLSGAHFQLRNYSESIFYCQQAIRINPGFAEAYGNLGNSLRELGDVNGAIQFYLKAIKLKPRFRDAYNNLACAYMQLGKTKQAVETYQMALVLDPCFVDAHSNMGNLMKAQGKLGEARKYYLEAIRLRPDFAIAWSNLAGIFREEGDLETALAYYQEAVRLNPDFASAFSNMGNACKELGRTKEAEDAYKKAIELRPDFAIAHANMGNLYYDQGELDKAMKSLKHAVQLEPNFPDAHNTIGCILRDLGCLDEAIEKYRNCIKLKPDHPHAYNNLGNALKDKGMIKEAVHCYMTACRLMPRFAVSHMNLGSILKEQGRLEQAIAHYHEAIAIDPDFAAAYVNLGNAFKDAANFDEAIKCYTNAIKLKPNFSIAFCNLACTYNEADRYDDAITCFRKALALQPDYADASANLTFSLAMICDWRSRIDDLRQLQSLLDEQLRKCQIAIDRAIAGRSDVEYLPLPSVQPFHTLAYPSVTPRQQLEIGRAYALSAERNVALFEIPPFRFKAKLPGERLRIGYVSSDFGHHPTCHMMSSLFFMYDRSKFEVFCYALNPHDQSELRSELEEKVEHFRDIHNLSPGDSARVIHSDQVHILIDLNGYTRGARPGIFALQPAPIQMVFSPGYMATSGAKYMHYIVGDRFTIPASLRAESITENVVELPKSCIIADYKRSARFVLDPDQCPSRSQYGLPENKFIFANFNQGYKIDPDTFDLWCRILKRVPNSVLWLVRFTCLAETNLRAEARARGIEDKRLIFTDPVQRKEHLKRAYLADLVLETPYCNGLTTACDVLWAGTPIMTCKDVGNGKIASRTTASVLAAADLDHLLCTSDLEEYENSAVDLALNVEKLWSIRKQLEEARLSCALFDTQRWISNFQQALQAVWHRHEQGKPAQHISFDEAQEQVGR